MYFFFFFFCVMYIILLYGWYFFFKSFFSVNSSYFYFCICHKKIYLREYYERVKSWRDFSLLIEKCSSFFFHAQQQTILIWFFWIIYIYTINAKKKHNICKINFIFHFFFPSYKYIHRVLSVAKIYYNLNRIITYNLYIYVWYYIYICYGLRLLGTSKLLTHFKILNNILYEFKYHIYIYIYFIKL